MNKVSCACTREHVTVFDRPVSEELPHGIISPAPFRGNVKYRRLRTNWFSPVFHDRSRWKVCRKLVCNKQTKTLLNYPRWSLAVIRALNPKWGITDCDVELLAGYTWPGNIRELQKVIERAVIISQGDPLRVDAALGMYGVKLHPAAIRGSVLSREELKRRERQNILAALGASNGKIYGPDGAAAILGMKPTTLTSRMKKMKIELPQSA